jgi:hypothetical protein
MKSYEKRLLSRLQSEERNTNNLPLENIKKSLGSIRFVKGNPLTKTEITISIRTWFVQPGFGIIAPNLLPANLQTSLPIWMFGLTDYYGGYNKSQIINPIRPGWFLYAQKFTGVALNGFNSPNSMGIWGYNMFTVNSPVTNSGISYGDFVICFADVDPNFNGNPTFYAFVVIHCENVAYGTFLKSFVSDLITINTFRYIVPIANINQFINPLIFGYQTLFGKVNTDSIDPRNYITSKDFQQQISDIPINLPIDKAVMLGFQLDIFCQNLSMILFVEKVEPLTHK